MFRWNLMLRRHFRLTASHPMQRHIKRRPQLKLEELEDRITPATWTVNLATDNNANANGQQTGPTSGDLRYCVENAPSGSTIQFAIGLDSQTITLADVIRIPNKDLLIDGGLDSNIAISGNQLHQIFNITRSSEVEIDNLTLEYGRADAGGAVFDSGNSLKLVNDYFFGNQSDGPGGAVLTNRAGNLTAAPLNVINCEFEQNDALGVGADGGAISASTTSADAGVVLNGCSFISNKADGNGGAVDAEGDPATTLQVSSCTFEMNTSGRNGGAIFTTDTSPSSVLNPGFTPAITQSVFTSNAAEGASPDGNGGAIEYKPASNASSTLFVTYSTFNYNAATTGSGGGIDATS